MQLEESDMTCQVTCSSSRTSRAARRDSVVAGGHRTATATAGLKDTGSIATDLSPHAGRRRVNGQGYGRAPVCRRVWLPSASPHRYRARTYLWCKGDRSAKCLRVTARSRVSKMGTISLGPRTSIDHIHAVVKSKLQTCLPQGV